MKRIWICVALVVGACANQVSPSNLANAESVVAATIVADQATISLLNSKGNTKGAEQAQAILASLQSVDASLKAAETSKAPVTVSDLLGSAASAVLAYTMFIQQEAVANGK